MGNRVISWLAHEVRHMLPPTIFFLVSLNLIVLTVALLSDDHELSAVSHISACVGALLIGKAFLLADKLPVMRQHINRPLIYGALWSALVYFMMILALHLAERLISAATNSQGFLFRTKAEMEESARDQDRVRRIHRNSDWQLTVSKELREMIVWNL